ncbi:MAG: FxsA family protein [Deltaproteobacteria bacterium]|nr:FxsA family protein [Deltaproteobacteria bacterium]
MLGKLLLLFTVVPVVELYLLITIGQTLGAELTIGLVLVTGLLGASLAKREGGRVLRNWQGAMARGEMPKEGVVSSLLVLVGGVLLVTPGVVTDATGLLLLIPWTRRWVAAFVRKRMEHRIQVHSFVPGPEAFMGAGMAGPDAAPTGAVIDVDVVDGDPVPAREADDDQAPAARPN